MKTASLHHSFDIQLAQEFGIEEAILIHHFQHWIRINKKLGRNLKERQSWSYQSQKELQAHFPYMTLETIKYTLEKLIDRGILIRKNFNKNPIDKTWWYAFVKEDLWLGPDPDISNKVYDTENSVSTRKIPSPIPYTKSKDTNNPPPVPFLTDPPNPKPATKEEEEEIEERRKNRGSLAPPIKVLKRWKLAVLEDIRRENLAEKGKEAIVERHRKAAKELDYTKTNGLTISACKDWVEFTHGSYVKVVRYDLSEEEWKEQTGWK